MISPVEFRETADIETSSEDYARRFSGSVGAWFLRVQEEITLRTLAPYPGATILDVGGGHGQLTGALVRANYDVTVVASADVCKARIQPYLDMKRCAFEVGDFLKLPYPDQSFGVVISYRLLPHVTHWREFLAELTRVAHKAVIIDYPEADSINTLTPFLFKVKKGLEGNTRTYTMYRRAELIDEFRKHGFIYGEHHPEFFVPMVIHRKLKTPTVSRALEGVSRGLSLTRRFGSPVILKMIREGV